MKRLATCCCRDIGIEVEGEPEIHCVCHSDNCKRRTGSAFGISAYFKDAQIVQCIGETNVFKKIPNVKIFTNGSTVRDMELKLGPYGSEWRSEHF